MSLICDHRNQLTTKNAVTNLKKPDNYQANWQRRSKFYSRVLMHNVRLKPSFHLSSTVDELHCPCSLMSKILCIPEIIFSLNDYRQWLADRWRLMKTRLNILLNRAMFSDNDDIRRLMSTGYDYEIMLPTIKDATDCLRNLNFCGAEVNQLYRPACRTWFKRAISYFNRYLE